MPCGRTEHIGSLIKMISEDFERKANNLLNKFNITNSQARLLIVLMSKRDGQCCLKELEKEFSFSSVAIAGIVNRLELKGYLLAFADEKDKRKKRVKLTESGYEIGQKCIDSLLSLEKEYLNNLDEKEQNELINMLKKIIV